MDRTEKKASIRTLLVSLKPHPLVLERRHVHPPMTYGQRSISAAAAEAVDFVFASRNLKAPEVPVKFRLAVYWTSKHPGCVRACTYKVQKSEVVGNRMLDLRGLFIS